MLRDVSAALRGRLRMWAAAAAVIGGFACLTPTGAGATGVQYRALLIGVSEYPNLKPQLQLQGPRNDVQRMRDVLVQRGVPASSITLLADGVQGAALPTRQAIINRLEELARTARPQDYIIISFGGHGSQVPVPSGHPQAVHEADGLFEVFLPRDVQGWNGSTTADGSLGNAIHDHEVRALVDRIAASGAFVWVVFDTCHSATMVRSVGTASSEVRLRQASPAELGIPAEALARAQARAAEAQIARLPPSAPPQAGKAVYFYAAQTTEATAEMPLPMGHPQRQPHGVFTHFIAQTLEGGGGMTYRQLFNQVLTRYGSVAEARSTPLMAGTQLDSPVLGLAAPAVRQWRLVGDGKLAVQAGSLTDLGVGSVVAILANAVDTPDKALGFARVTQSSLTRSELQPVEHEGKPARPAAELAKGSVAQLVRAAPSLSLTVGVDLRRCSAPCPFDAAIAQLKTRANEPPPTSRSGEAVAPRLPMVFTGPGQAANVTLTAVGARLWVLPPSLAEHSLCSQARGAARQACEAEAERSIASVVAAAGATADGLAQTLSDMLRSVAKVENLLRISALAGQSEGAQRLQTSVRFLRNGQPMTAAELTRACTTGSGERVAAAARPAQGQCLLAGDTVELNISNQGDRPVDVTVLYIDSRFGVSSMYPVGGAVNRLEAKAGIRLPLQVNDDTTGTERMVILGAEASAQRSGSVDLSFLAQATLDTVVQMRSIGRDDKASASPLEDVVSLFRSAGFGEGLLTRGMAPPSVPTRVGAQVFTWQVRR